MSKPYQNMRAFWLDAKNFETRQGILEIGPNKIIAAGVEMAVADAQIVKHLLIVTNSLGDSSLYFENNSPSGLGGMIGGHGHAALQEAAAHMLAYASKLTPHMESVAASEPLVQPSDAGRVILFCVSKETIFYKEFTQGDVRNPEHPFYPMFAYSQQMIGLFQNLNTQNTPPAHS